MVALDFKNGEESNISPQEINQDINSSDENDSSVVYDERIFNADIHNDIMDIVNNGDQNILKSYQHEGCFDYFVEEIKEELNYVAERMDKGESNESYQRFAYRYLKKPMTEERIKNLFSGLGDFSGEIRQNVLRLIN